MSLPQYPRTNDQEHREGCNQAASGATRMRVYWHARRQHR